MKVEDREEWEEEERGRDRNTRKSLQVSFLYVYIQVHSSIHYMRHLVVLLRNNTKLQLGT